MTFDNNRRINGIGDILISSRSLAEYRAMFTLTDNDLSRQILDCPGGGAGFTSEVSNRGGDVTACDVAYFENSADGLAAIATSETDRGNHYVRAHAEQYEWTFFADPDDHQRSRQHAAQQFAAHIRRHPDHYIPGRLPALPFADASFDLVLSSHLLFSYAERLDHAFHVNAITELMRVTSGELRTPHPEVLPFSSRHACYQRPGRVHLVGVPLSSSGVTRRMDTAHKDRGGRGDGEVRGGRPE